ncbi:MAG: ABC transporter permease [Solirubrobacteraceae bacterium]|nr:ABC transporter permease [Solirubrobacteraceae bacterium]
MARSAQLEPDAGTVDELAAPVAYVPPDGDAALRRRSLTDQPWAPVVLGAIGILLSLAAWDMLSRSGFVSPQDLPPSREVVVSFFEQLRTSEFWGHVGNTLRSWSIGLALSASIAIPVGLALGSSWAFWRALRPTVEFLRAVPGVALVPVAILLWGQGIQGSVALIVFGSVWVLMINAMYGARQLDEVARDTARVFGLNRVERIRWLVVPGALPYVATGLRIASAAALITAVTAELVIGSPGMGSAIAKAQTAGATVKMYGLILGTGMLGLVTHLFFQRLEGHFLRWHLSQQKAG